MLNLTQTMAKYLLAAVVAAHMFFCGTHTRRAEAAETSPPIWTYKTRQAQLAADDAGTLAEWKRRKILRTPLAASEDGVYLSSALSHRVVCLDAATGKLRWKYTAVRSNAAGALGLVDRCSRPRSML